MSLQSSSGSPTGTSSGSPAGITSVHSATVTSVVTHEQPLDTCESKEPATAKFLRAATLSRLEHGPDEKLWSFGKCDGEEFDSVSGDSTPNACEMGTVENECKGGYDNREWLSLRGVRRLCRHPVFQLSRQRRQGISGL